MAKAYTPGLKVSARASYRARRVLPVPGEVLVKTGAEVKARETVARTFIDGEVTPVAVASQLAVPAGDLAGIMLVKQGDAVKAGQPIARTKGIFGLGKKELASPADGTVESISATTGQMILRGAPIAVEVRAYVDGRVAEVLPGEGAVVEMNGVYLASGKRHIDLTSRVTHGAAGLHGVAAVDQHVARIDIAVDQADGMNHRDGLGDLHDQI